MPMTRIQWRNYNQGRVRAEGLRAAQQHLGAPGHIAAVTVLEETIGHMVEDTANEGISETIAPAERNVIAFRLGMIDAMAERLAEACGFGDDYPTRG